MIKDITIGQYFPGNSFVHRLDPRLKILEMIALIALIFVCNNFVSLGAVVVLVVAIVLVSKIPVKTILKSIKPLLFIIIFTAVLNLFYGSGEPLVKIGFLKITENGIITAVFMAVRIVSLVIISSLLTYTTSPTSLTDAIESLLKPLTYVKVDVHTIAMTMTIALRFIPTLIEEIDKIMSAQKSRGADMESGNIIQRSKALVPILIPLFISSFRRANDLAYAMECRCYSGGKGRTKMKQMKFHTLDYFSMAFVAAIFAGVILINHFIGPIL